MKGPKDDSKDDSATKVPEAATRKDVLNFEEAAAFLGVSTKTFTKVLRHENLPGRKVGREWKFSRAALIAWLSAGRVRDYHDDADGEAPAEPDRAGARAMHTLEPRARSFETFAAEED